MYLYLSLTDLFEQTFVHPSAPEYKPGKHVNPTPPPGAELHIHLLYIYTCQLAFGHTLTREYKQTSPAPGVLPLALKVHMSYTKAHLVAKSTTSSIRCADVTVLKIASDNKLYKPNIVCTYIIIYKTAQNSTIRRPA